MAAGGEKPWYRRRKHLSVYVTPQAYEAFKTLAREHDVSVAALVEQLGIMIAAGFPILDTSRKQLIEGAKKIDEQRRSRKKH